MSENEIQQLQAIGQKIKTHQNALEALRSLINKQSMRALRLPQIFKFSPSEAEFFDKIFGAQNSDPYEDYSKLLSKQIKDKITEVSKKFDDLRVQISKVITQAKRKKSNPNPNAQQFQSKVSQVLEQMVIFWKEQSFLIANYRLDISAKQLQQWNRGLYFTGGASDAKEIDQMFKP